MKHILSIISIFLVLYFPTFGQADCSIADFGCTLDDFTVNSSGSGLINDLPPGLTISNPTTNPGSAGNSGCLFSGELNPTWIIFTISTPGFFEFTLGGPGGNGFYDWSLWPYYEAGSPESIQGGDACAEIQSNLLPPVACNWNASSGGYTGMVMQGNLPPGANQGNFEHSFWANPGDQFVLMFSNFSGLVGATVPIYTGTDIPGNGNNQQTAAVTCDPSSIGTTICEGDVATIFINSGGIIGATYTFLNNVGDLVDPTQTGPSFDLSPLITTTYQILVSNAAISDTIEVTITVVPPPAPNAGGDFTICAGSPGQLNGSLFDSDNNFSWAFTGPTGTQSPPNVVYTPNANSLTPLIQVNHPGQYTFTLTESNGVCPDESDVVQVLFSQATLSATSTNAICAGANDGTITINSPNANAYSFDNGATWVSSNVHGGFMAGSYAVCVENSDGCSACTTIIVEDGAGMTITVSSDTTICENGTANLMATAQGGNTIEYTWSHTPTTDGNQTIAPIQSDTYAVFATNEFGCTTTSEVISVTILPSLSGTIIPEQTICPGFSTLLTGTATGGNGGPYTYNWFDDIGNMIGSTQTITVSPSLTTNYTLIVTDNCESSPFVQNTIVYVSQLPEVQFTVDSPGKCTPAIFEFTNATNPTQVAETYWYFSDGQSFANTNNFNAFFTLPGSYDLQLVIVTPDGCVDSLKTTNLFTVYSKPIANFNITPDPVTIFTTYVQFQNWSTGATSFEWYIDGGIPFYSELKDPSTYYPEEVVNDYPVELIVTSEFGCKDTANAFVNVRPEIILYAPNTFTPDGDEFNNEWRIYISGIERYRNFDLEIFNRWGEIMFASYDPDGSWDGTYGGRKVPEGTYIWKIRAEDGYTDAKYEWNGHVTILY